MLIIALTLALLFLAPYLACNHTLRTVTWWDGRTMLTISTCTRCGHSTHRTSHR